MMALANAASVALLGAPPPHLTGGLVGVLLVEFVRILFLGGPLGEELGWRGFALPRLQQHRTALTSSILLGVIWGFWHIPLYFVPGTGQHELLRTGTSPSFPIGGFVGWTVGLSVLFTWLASLLNVLLTWICRDRRGRVFRTDEAGVDCTRGMNPAAGDTGVGT